MGRKREDSRCTDRVVGRCGRVWRLREVRGGNRARRSGASLTFRPKHGQPQVREEAGDCA